MNTNTDQGKRTSETLPHNLQSLTVLLLVSALLVVGDVVTDGPLTRLDAVIHDYGWRYRQPGLDSVMESVALLGQRGVIFLPALLIAYLFARKARSWQPVILLGVATLLLNLTVGATKILTGRPVPRDGDMLIFADGHMGFPSGHAANTVVTYGILVYLAHRARSPRTKTGARLGVTATLLVGVATVYLETHWGTDLLAGWLYGAIIVTGTIALDQARPDLAGDARRLLRRGIRERAWVPQPQMAPSARTGGGNSPEGPHD